MKLILGCGITGVSVANYLSKIGEKFVIADSRENPKLANTLPSCQKYFGSWNKKILDNISQIIISPGINPNEKIVIWAKEKGVEIMSDIDIFYIYNKSKTFIGITGSNGKSTTTKLLEFVLQKLGKKAIACGNIGTPVLDIDTQKYDIYVLELSSYQLDYSTILKLDYGVILNITPDHLDRYHTFENYIDSKLKIYQISQNNIINPHNTWTKNFNGKKFIDFGIDLSKTNLLGEHNKENILVVLTICQELGLSINDGFEYVKRFKGLEHRLECVATIDNCTYYNDSKATNAIATLTAIDAIKNKYKNMGLILGGRKKDEDYQQLFDLVNNTIKKVLLIGESKEFFAKNITIEKYYIDSFADIKQYAKNMDCVLLSPACASFDMFESFENRGNEFKMAIL